MTVRYITGIMMTEANRYTMIGSESPKKRSSTIKASPYAAPMKVPVERCPALFFVELEYGCKHQRAARAL